MTAVEFKAWFEGFTEAMEGTPTQAQWDRIKARVAQINVSPQTPAGWDHIKGRLGGGGIAGGGIAQNGAIVVAD